jgi:hypothetical protein
MGEGFTAKPGQPTDPLAEHGAWSTKLDAAKELLLRQVGSLRVQDLAVFQFTDRYSKLFQGTRDQLLQQDHLIRSLRAGGGGKGVWWKRGQSPLIRFPVANLNVRIA